MSSDRLEGPGSTDKPLGDAGSGASGGGSLGNQAGTGAATGGDPAQGVRQPLSDEQVARFSQGGSNHEGASDPGKTRPPSKDNALEKE